MSEETEAAAPLLTILTVVRNDVDRLKITLDSVASQTFSDYEHLVVDGGSTDGSLEVARSAEAESSHIRVVEQADRGIYDAMNQAVHHVKGGHVLFLNCGDLLASAEVLGLLTSHLDQDFLFASHWVDYGKFRRLIPVHEPFDVMHGMPVSHQSMVCRTSLLRTRKFDLRFRICADYDFLVASILDGATYRILKEPISIVEPFGISNRRKTAGTTEQIRILMLRSRTAPLSLKIRRVRDWLSDQVTDRIPEHTWITVAMLRYRFAGLLH